MQDGDSVEISYQGQLKTVSYSKSIATATTDRTTAGDGNTIVVRMNDPDANIDPTASDSFVATPAIVTATGVTGATLNLGAGSKFKEQQGSNSGAFELPISLSTTVPPSGATFTAAGATSTSSGIAFPQSVSFTINDADQYLAITGAATATSNPTASPTTYIATGSTTTSVAAVTLQNEDGAITLVAPVSISNGVAVKVNDPDRNIDTKSRDNLNTGTVFVTIDSGTLRDRVFNVGGLTLGTAAVAHTGAISVPITLTFSGSPGATTASLTGTGALAGVTFTAPPVAETLGADVVQANGLVTKTLSLSIPYSTVGGVAEAAIGTVQVTVTVSNNVALVAMTPGAVGVTAGDTSTGAPTTSFSAALAGQIVSTGAGGGLPFRETDVGSGMFIPDVTDNDIPIGVGAADAMSSSAITVSPGTISGDPDVAITYLDLAAQPTGQKAFQLVTKLIHTAGSITGPSNSVPLTSKFSLTINDGDLNLNSDSPDSFVITFKAGTSTTASVLPPGGTNNFLPGGVTTAPGSLGMLTLKVQGTGQTVPAGKDLSMTFIETGASTGVFTANNIDMGIINGWIAGGLKDGDQVEFKYNDNSESPVATSTATITVGKLSIGISTDRTTIPIPSVSTDVLILTITDPSRDVNPTSIDSFTFPTAANGMIQYQDQQQTAFAGTFTDGRVLAGLGPITMVETGPSTGVFTAKYSSIALGTATITDANNAKIKFTYTSGTSTETVTVTMKSYDGTVTTNMSVVQNGDQLVITVNDPDMNQDPTTAEKLLSGVAVGTAGTVDIQGKNDVMPAGVLGSTAVVLTDMLETGPDTGIFQKTVTVGKDFRISNIPAVAGWTGATFATNVDIKYHDAITTTGQANIERELNVRVNTHTGTISVTPDIVGPGTKLSVTVNDPDLNANPTGIETIQSSTDFVQVTSNNTRAPTPSLTAGGLPQAEETGANSGQFKFTVKLAPITAPAGGNPQTVTPVFGNLGTKDITYQVLPGELLSIKYSDQKDASGNKAVVSKIIQIISKDPEITSDSDNVAVGDTAKITIADPDANTDGEAVDSLQVKITSNSDPVGFTLTAQETGPNTGVFTVNVPTSTSVNSGSITVKAGDNITVKYNDRYPADYSSRVKQVADPSKDFFFNLQVGGAAAGVGSTTPSPVTPTDLGTGQTVTEIKAGQQVQLVSVVHNNQDATRNFVAIIQVKDSNGVVQAIIIAGSQLVPNGDAKVGGSFTPDTAGTYTVQTFVLSDIGSPMILASPSTTNLTVS